MRRGLERQLRGEVGTLSAELHQARRDLERVTAQRDELRRVIGNVRSYAHQEAERAVADNLQRRGATEPHPESWEAMVPHPRMRPTVALAAHLSDPELPERPPALDACYHPAEDSSMEAFWHRCHGTHEPCAHG